MNKLLAMLAILSVALGALAEAQVYEMQMTLKTTVSASGKITPVVCDTPTSEINLYRKQSTVKIKGLFWGCDCETIADPIRVESPSATYGYIFWNETTRQVIDSEFVWKVLNRIDKKCKKAEGAWTIASTNGTFCLVGGGFGTVKDEVSKDSCSISSTILTPMSGNVAGWMSMPAIVVAKGTESICEKCSVVEGRDDVVARAPGWSLCACGDGSEFSAVSGTWKLKYNAGVAKKWSKASVETSIVEVYSFPSYVKTYIENL